MAYTKTAKPTATFTKEPKYLNCGRHHYGTEFGKTTRILYGDYVRYGGTVDTSWNITVKPTV